MGERGGGGGIEATKRPARGVRVRVRVDEAAQGMACMMTSSRRMLWVGSAGASAAASEGSHTSRLARGAPLTDGHLDPRLPE